MNYDIQIAYDQPALLGECPVWCNESQMLYWVDIKRGRLNRLNPKNQNNEYIDFGEDIGCFAFREQGGFVVALRSGLYLLDDFSTEAKQFIANPQQALKANRFNDGKCDMQGRFWAGTMTETKAKQDGALYCLHHDLSVEEKDNGVYTSNGLAFSNNKMFYADTPSFTIYHYDLDSKAKISNKAVFFTSPESLRPGRPDGACLDSEGNYWVAMYEGACVLKLSSKGEILEQIKLPVKYPTMPCFGDENLQTLYITSANGDLSEEEKKLYPHNGKIIKIKTNIKGLLPHRFKEKKNN